MGITIDHADELVIRYFADIDHINEDEEGLTKAALSCGMTLKTTWTRENGRRNSRFGEDDKKFGIARK